MEKKLTPIGKVIEKLAKISNSITVKDVADRSYKNAIDLAILRATELLEEEKQEKDADAIGFALWLDHKYYSTTQGMWADSGNGNEYTLEELYLIYLKQK